MAIVVLLVIVFLALWGTSNPYVGLLGLVVVYVVQPGELYPSLAPLHLERTLAAFVLASFFFHGNRFKFPTVTRWFLAFYGAIILAVPLAFWRGNSIQFVVSFAEIVTYHLLIVALLNTEQRFNRFLYTFIALMGWLAGTSAFLYMKGVRIVTMGIERAEGLTSSGGDPNSLGLTLVAAMPLEFLLMSKGNPIWARLMAAGVFLVSFWTVIETGSRTSFFAFCFFLVLLTFADWRKRLKFVPLLLALGPMIWIAIPQQYKARYETVDNLKRDDSYQNRLLSWQGGVQMFLHNPITGVGPDNYTSANGEQYWPERPRHYLDAHNLFFKLIAELGVVGVFMFVGYLVNLFRLNAGLLRHPNAHGSGILVNKFPLYCNLSLIVLLFAGYSGHNLYRDTWYMLGAMSCAIGLLTPAVAKVAAKDQGKKQRHLPAWVPKNIGPEAEPALRLEPGRS